MLPPNAPFCRDAVMDGGGMREWAFGRLVFLIMGYKTTIVHIMMLKNEKIYDIIKVNKCDDIYSNIE